MDKKKLLVKAKLAEQIERYEDMAKIMKTITEQEEKLSNEERNLLSVAYKNVVGARRSSSRVLSSVESKAEECSLESQEAAIYRLEVEKELKDICTEVLVAYPISHFNYYVCNYTSMLMSSHFKMGEDHHNVKLITYAVSSSVV